ncbi:neutrophil gelatinase-associated lipocalin-like [Cavia porcellus]|uniref:neutrophil gelatinase-associated lipocalin-like n=1 Tax=Cavia porcellus TaxID=10141 RepID=UPI002FE2EEFC
MALGLLWLCLTLLWTPKTQAQKFPFEVKSQPSLSKAYLMSNFQPHQFQGVWHVIGWAQNTNVNESLSHMNMYHQNFELKDNGTYNVTSWWLSDQGCIPYVDTFVPTDLPGQYILKDVTRYKGLQNLTMRVMDSDYKRNAMVFYEAIVNNSVYIECVLYERNRWVNGELIWYFTGITMDMGFLFENIDSTILKRSPTFT